MATRQQFVVFAVAIAVVLSGCAGWGTDGPDDDLDESDPAQANSSNESGAGESDSDGENQSQTESASDSKSEHENQTESGDNATDSDDSGANDGAKEDGTNTDTKNSNENGADGGENETNGEPSTHTLTVTVTDPNDDPVANETVHILTYDGGADVASGTTDENGQVQFELEDGDYEVAVSASDKGLLQPSDNRLVTIDGEDVEFPVQLQSAGGDDPETHTLTVTIIDQTNAGPMQGTATVNGDTKDVPGDQGAQFELENGTYTVTGETSEDGWHVGTERVTIDGDDAKVALPANPIQTVTVETGEPGVDVTLTEPAADEKETKTTGDDGRVEFEALPGNYSITADGYESAEVTVPGAHDPAPVELTPKTTSTPTHTLTITNAGTAPVEIMEDAPPDEDPKTTTHEPVDGVVETEVAEGSYYISTDDRVDTLVGVYVDDDTEITLQDPDPGPLTIEVVDAETGDGIDGAEISGLCHLWYSGGDEYITGTTGSDGVADAQPGVSPTICETTIRADGYEDEHLRISVPEDDGLVVELQPVDEASDGAANDSANTSNATATVTATAAA